MIVKGSPERLQALKDMGHRMRASFKIDRHCPRCGAHHYHWYSPVSKKVTCTNCGHDWRARIMEKDL